MIFESLLSHKIYVRKQSSANERVNIFVQNVINENNLIKIVTFLLLSERSKRDSAVGVIEQVFPTKKMHAMSASWNTHRHNFALVMFRYFEDRIGAKIITETSCLELGGRIQVNL